METGSRGQSVDLSSRILAILSLLVALLTAVYVYTLNQMTESRQQLEVTFQEQLEKKAAEFDKARDALAAQYQASIEKHNQRLDEWNLNLNDAISSFRADGTKLLDQIAADDSAAQQARAAAFQNLIAGNTTQSPGPAAAEADANKSSAREVSTADTVPEINSPDNSSLASVDREAKLRVSETLFRAGTGNTTVFTVTNDSKETAQIRGLRFRPQAEFQNSDAPEISSNIVQGAVTSINFAPTDNTSTRAGYHGSYHRELESVILIPAGESRVFRVTIVDPEHTDWGFVGRLELDYNSSKPLVIEAARVTFIAKS